MLYYCVAKWLEQYQARGSVKGDKQYYPSATPHAVDSKLTRCFMLGTSYGCLWPACALFYKGVITQLFGLYL